MTALALIPARGGSKRCPGKNARLCAGKPLVAWTIEAAKACQDIDAVYVSTDDECIGVVAQAFGADVIWRPSAISQDDSPKEQAIQHAVDRFDHWHPDWKVCAVLNPTNPLRTPHTISMAVHKCAPWDEERSCVTVTCDPMLWFSGQDTPNGWTPDNAYRPRTQDVKAHREAGGTFAFTRACWEAHRAVNAGWCKPHEIGEEEAIDVNTEFEFELADWALRRRLVKEAV